MGAEIRLTLSDEHTAKLDRIREPASRTAMAWYLLQVAIDVKYAELARDEPGSSWNSNDPANLRRPGSNDHE